ncbi:methyltransferase domain-containing protein [Nakamurella sp. YIM 132087]|uniref:Methyltransferase domain-containing protein n=1 Tax=Nakamurella alba TaxID=2665158 RepID=A0A7K1FQV4_9ACTN|nr:methyltransferase domain-containing protein [Nakamurella alba]MTD16525.1 methyltransferase domain-containing protein [Nakamurella alba]
MTRIGAPVDPVTAALGDLLGGLSGARVLDVGGGSGTRAVPLALAGCTVTVLDASIDALAILRRRAADAGVAESVVAVQADAEGVAGTVAPGSADLVLCHQLLEEIDDPAAVVGAVAQALVPGGVLSVLTAGRGAAVVAQARAGRPAEAAAILQDSDGRWGAGDPLRRRFDEESLRALLTGAGLVVESVTGSGAVAGLLAAGGTTAPRQWPADDSATADLERVLAAHPVFKELAPELHAVGRRPAD